MAVSKALENSAKAFSVKYHCEFDFAAFESRVEEFTFLRPNNGWCDVYKVTFDQVYKKALLGAIEGQNAGLDGEAMLDDFEYTLIRPYVKENEGDVRHKPYVGMDRISRLEYLERLTKEAPSNPVELYMDKYKKGELSVGQMHRQARSSLDIENPQTESYVEVAGYIEALENVNKGRSFIGKAFHPFKNSAEKRETALMKDLLAEKTQGGEDFYKEITAAAYQTFDGHSMVSARLMQSTLNAREEMSQRKKMNDAIRESIRIEGLEGERETERSTRVEQHKIPMMEKQNLI